MGTNADEKATYTGVPKKHPLPRGKYVIASEEELATLTAEGAHLIEVLPIQRLGFMPSAVKCPMSRCAGRHVYIYFRDNAAVANCNSCNNTFAVNLSTPPVINGYSFLVMIEVDQVYEDLRVKVRHERAAFDAEFAARRRLEEQLKDADQQRQEMLDAIQLLNAKVGQLNKALEAAQNDLKGQR